MAPIIAQLSTPDMCLPIQYALTYPNRGASDRVQTSLAEIGRLDFEETDTDRFPALNLARRAGEVGGTLPAVLNAANEIAVEAFCDQQISFTDISENRFPSNGGARSQRAAHAQANSCGRLLGTGSSERLRSGGVIAHCRGGKFLLHSRP